MQLWACLLHVGESRCRTALLQFDERNLFNFIHDLSRYQPKTHIFFMRKHIMFKLGPNQYIGRPIILADIGIGGSVVYWLIDPQKMTAILAEKLRFNRSIKFNQVSIV